MKAIKSMNLLQKIGLFLSTFSLLSFVSHANAEPKVVASIKPLHSLVSYVMDGVGTPEFQHRPLRSSLVSEVVLLRLRP